MRPTRRRGFAMIAAIGILAVMALIVIALSESHSAQLQIKRHWSDSADERLATRWAIDTLLPMMEEGGQIVMFDAMWGRTALEMHALALDETSAIYEHPALSHRAGDFLITLRFKDNTHYHLVRSGARATHHRLPAGLIPQSEELN